MYEYLGHDENARIAKAHARWSRAKLMATTFVLVCAGIALLGFVFLPR